MAKKGKSLTTPTLSASADERKQAYESIKKALAICKIACDFAVTNARAVIANPATKATDLVGASASLSAALASAADVDIAIEALEILKEPVTVTPPVIPRVSSKSDKITPETTPPPAPPAGVAEPPSEGTGTPSAPVPTPTAPIVGGSTTAMGESNLEAMAVLRDFQQGGKVKSEEHRKQILDSLEHLKKGGSNLLSPLAEQQIMTALNTPQNTYGVTPPQK